MLKGQAGYGEYIIQIFPNNFLNKKRVYDITFQVTEDCNLRCNYCYQINKTKNKMSFETAKKFIDYLFENKDNPDFLYNEKKAGGFIIEFIGGEPLLEIDLIEQIIDYFEYKFLLYPESQWLYSHSYNISSNGTLYFTPKVQKVLKKFGPLVNCGITIDGNKELHDSCRIFPDGSGSYELALKAGLAELKKGYQSTKITISPTNVNYIFNGIKNMINIGFRYININCCFEDVWDKKSAKNLFNELIKVADWIKINNLYDKIYIAILAPFTLKSIPKESLKLNWCGVGQGGMLAIDPKGYYYPCLRFMPSSLGSIEPITFGNTKTGLLSNNKEKENYQKLIKCTREKLSDENCLTCPIAEGCSWCLGYSYQYYNGLNRKTNFICDTHKMRALATKYLLKIIKDKENYDLIKLNYNMYKDLISEEEFNKINSWEV